MTTRLAINGFGRIGRCFLRALIERGLTHELQVVAINELADAKTIAHLTKFDSTHGPFAGKVETNGEHLLIDQLPAIRLLQESDISALPWTELQVDLVVECSGSFSDITTAEAHLAQGAQRLLFSQPATAEVDATVVYGFNQQRLTGAERIISTGSCSTNCLIPVLDAVHRAFTIEAGTTWTIHSAMHDQPVLDAYHNTDLRKTRSAFASIIPVDTGLDRGIDRLLPELTGRFQSLAMRVPTVNVSAIDCALQLDKPATVEQVNQVLAEAAAKHYQGVLGYLNEPVASCDFNHDPRSGIVDASQTRVSQEHLLALHIWFDNEWGYANRMVDATCYWSKLWSIY
ncbi:type I glyceraldehyde-3-phosphate dehydrogenase [Halioxenophilus sp. WMMB6]|uniref:type I glyceraldehyde-3-phosphate dehydrogenase n=1 Tax=Halioxenophilus sp. WMMB6 TaxID=3073815 RepID=UPI00295F1380|nr:glyceraldehyde 3-phosphate dehydrogenase NAD-binding domain-containing protein [Halioxenophilus sp. WMMB6]